MGRPVVIVLCFHKNEKASSTFDRNATKKKFPLTKILIVLG